MEAILTPLSPPPLQAGRRGEREREVEREKERKREREGQKLIP